jgi:hypothetical protein
MNSAVVIRTDPYLLLELLVPRGWNGVLPNFHHFRELDLVVRLEGGNKPSSSLTRRKCEMGADWHIRWLTASTTKKTFDTC